MARIFVSSTYEDLKEYRDATFRALERLGHDVLGMYEYAQTHRDVIEQTIRDVDVCDAYVGLIAWTYGETSATSNGEPLSAVEMTFKRALELNKPVFMFLLHEDVPWPRKWMYDAASDTAINARVVQFRNEVSQHR
jgi:hypothetical protein